MGRYNRLYLYMQYIWGFHGQRTKPTYEKWEADLRSPVNRRVMDASEEALREALIRMGWTPPKPTSGIDSPI